MTVQKISLERAMGIEPTSKAWEAFILPMNYARECSYSIIVATHLQENSNFVSIIHFF